MERSANFKKLQATLAQLFELDKADLDFGIYRVLRQRHKEIADFLENKLATTVEKTLAEFADADTAQLGEDLAKAEKAASDAGISPDESPKVQEFREKLGQKQDAAAVEEEIYSHLVTFFSRYYEGGDFISKRRYKGGDSYAIPYDGEEVKLIWSNMDQYYIKSSDLLRDYVFRWRPLGEAKEGELALQADETEEIAVHFKLAQGDTEKDNRRTTGNTTRAFTLDPDTPLEVSDTELIIRFRYTEHASKRNLQDHLNADTIKTLADDLPAKWKTRLFTKSPSDKAAERTVLEMHLRRYTAKFSFDYFIHKNLGGFLRRELDFYLKNEVMNLDDIEDESPPKVEEYLSKLRGIRRVALPVIKMLEQLENFQKKLWLKKKFVVETRYVLSLDRLPEHLYDEICKSNSQWEEWESLVTLSSSDEFSRTAEFLKTQPHLMIDSKHFEPQTVAKFLAAFDDLDSSLEGVLVHSDNFHALRLSQNRYVENAKCVYIDPPYNTSSSAILYKNSFQHSSWGSLLLDRLQLLKTLMRKDAAIFVSIDKLERTLLEGALDLTFGRKNRVEELIWTQNTANSQLPTYSTNHEYVEVYARDLATVAKIPAMFREPKPGFSEVMELVNKVNAEFPSIDDVEQALTQLYLKHQNEFRKGWEAQGRDWNDEAKRQDPWKGLFPYKKAEYRDELDELIDESIAKERNARLWIWREISTAAPAAKQSPTTRDPEHHNFRYYQPPHPVTEKPCSVPTSGWKFPYKPDPDKPSRRSFTSLEGQKRIAWGEDESKVPQTKGFLHEVETNIGTSVFYEYNDGEAEVAALFGDSGLFLSPKSSKFVRRFIAQTTGPSDLVVDCFGGSGSTAHGVINHNRENDSNRKYLVAEMGAHFDSLIVPRLKKAAYSSEWKDGEPKSRNTGLSHAFKIVRLESYEDCLNNLDLTRTAAEQGQLDSDPELKDSYMLSYFLDVESRNSLLNVEVFRDPFNYTLDIATSSAGETVPTKIDLIESFNWLLGVRVAHIDNPKGFVTVTGRNRDLSQKLLVIWRTLKGEGSKDHESLEAFLAKIQVNPADTEYDAIYINGPHTLEDPHNKIRLTEEHFHRLMFEGTD